jgi:hypothetical protein
MPPQDPNAQKDLTKYNPLKGGPNDLKIVRAATAQCTIPEDANFFNQMAMKMPSLEGDLTEVLEAAGKGIALIMGADSYCKKHLKTRTVANINEDTVLSDTHEKLKVKSAELEEKMAEMQALQQEVQTLTEARWEGIVRTYGLNPEERLYFIDEDDGIVEQLEIDCTDCTGAQKAQAVRLEVTNLLMLHQAPRKEEDHDGQREEDPGDGTPEGDAPQIGEGSDTEQEVPGVADPATPDGGDGDSSPPEAD